jgi:hypothetical protein
MHGEDEEEIGKEGGEERENEKTLKHRTHI